jgi:hypothetical protein
MVFSRERKKKVALSGAMRGHGTQWGDGAITVDGKTLKRAVLEQSTGHNYKGRPL